MHTRLEIMNVDSVFQISARVPPRTALEVVKIFGLGFFSNLHGSFVFACRVGIWNQKLSISFRFRVIGVFVPFYYVFRSIFAFRAALLTAFLVLRPRYGLPRPMFICTANLVTFRHFSNFLITLLPRVFPKNPLLSGFFEFSVDF